MEPETTQQQAGETPADHLTGHVLTAQCPVCRTGHSGPHCPPPKDQRKHEAAVNAEALAARWLADGNFAMERGNTSKAERCYAKSQYWLDRANKLSGRA